MKVFAAAAAMICVVTTATAGTLTIDWVGGPQTVEDYCCSSEGEVYSIPPWSGRFVFEVAGLSAPSFDYEAVLDPNEVRGDLAMEAVFNPQNGTLLARPDGHLGGFYAGRYDISVRRDGVSVSASLQDSDDFLSLSSSGVFFDHNAGLRYETSFGYWTASYAPDGASDGIAFGVNPGNVLDAPDPSPVPLPATAPLLLAGLGGIAAVRRKRTS